MNNSTTQRTVFVVETFDRKTRTPACETREQALRELSYQQIVHPEKSWVITEEIRNY